MPKTKLLVACAASFLLAACGGGGGGGTSSTSAPAPTTPATPTPDPVASSTPALQGLWQSTGPGASTAAAIVLPDGRMWQVITDASKSPISTRLVKANFVGQGGSYSGTAKRYVLDYTGAAATSATVSATVVEKVSLGGTITGAGLSETYGLTYLSRYDTAAALADFAGTWSATLGAGVVNWSISANGVLSGSRSTGCSYSGQFSLRTEMKAVVDVAITETCGATASLSLGVGAMNADKSRISLFMTSSDEASASVISLGR